MEIAFISSNKLRIELEKTQGKFTAEIIAIFIKKQEHYIATMLVGNNLALVIYGLTFAKILEPFLLLYINSAIGILILQTVISTLLILVTAEFLPKNLFMINPNRALNIFAIPIYTFYILFFPVTILSITLSNILLKNVLKIKLQHKDMQRKVVFGKIDLSHFVSQGNLFQANKEDIKHEIKFFQNALDFSKVKLRECIVPRTELYAIEINKSIEELRQKFIEAGYSKVLIYKESIDNIIGYVHSSELFKNPNDIQSCLTKISIVPETMPANKLLSMFINEHRSIAVVVDEFGGTAGIVSIEDIMEEIFGEIEDEHDSIELAERKKSENEYLFSGRLEIDYVNEKYNLKIPTSDDYETIAGFILYHHNSIPQQNESITIKGYNFNIVRASKTRIVLVNMKIL